MSNLSRADDTNPSPLVKKKKDCWDDSVKNDEDVKILSEDGSSIICGPCSNAKANNNQGVVRMRRNFASGNWFQHKKCGQHCNAVLSLVAESNDKNLKRKHQAGLGSFLFTTVTKKKKGISTRSSSSSSSSSATPQSASLTSALMTSVATSAPMAPTELYVFPTDSI